MIDCETPCAFCGSVPCEYISVSGTAVCTSCATGERAAGRDAVPIAGLSFEAADTKQTADRVFARKLSLTHAAALQPLWYGKPLPEPSRELYRELVRRRYPQGLGRAIGALELIAGAKTLVEAKRLAAKAIFDDAALDAAMEALEKLTERMK